MRDSAAPLSPQTLAALRERVLTYNATVPPGQRITLRHARAAYRRAASIVSSVRPNISQLTWALDLLPTPVATPAPRVPSLTAAISLDSLGRRYNPLLHPRGRDGRFIEVLGFVQIYKNSGDHSGFAVGEVRAINPDGSVQVHVTGAHDPKLIGSEQRVAPKNVSQAKRKKVASLGGPAPAAPQAPIPRTVAQLPNGQVPNAPAAPTPARPHTPEERGVVSPDEPTGPEDSVPAAQIPALQESYARRAHEITVSRSPEDDPDASRPEPICAHSITAALWTSPLTAAGNAGLCTPVAARSGKLGKGLVYDHVGDTLRITGDTWPNGKDIKDSAIAAGGRFGWDKPNKTWVFRGNEQQRQQVLQNLRDRVGDVEPPPIAEIVDPIPDIAELYPPTPEQSAIIDAIISVVGARTGRVVARALAGTGKTSTLQMAARRLLAANPRTQIAYVAFNKAIQREASRKMPRNTEARTGDSLAFVSAADDMKARNRKGLSRGDQVAAHLGITGPVGDIRADRVGRLVLASIGKYNISEDDNVTAQHLMDAGVPEANVREVMPYVLKAQADFATPTGKLYMSNDHFTKAWALNRPDLSGVVNSGLKKKATVIFFDEAQDINPVMARVIREQSIPVIYVGDSNQAIYGFRGATDELNKVQAAFDLPLTKSWRFGPEIAGMGNRFLQFSGAKHRVVGGGPAGRILEPGSMEMPDAVITRSNGGMIGEIVTAQQAGRTVGVPPNAKPNLVKLVETARFLQGGPRPKGALHEDLAPYRNWDAVGVAAQEGDDAKVKMLYKLVNENGVDELDRIVGQLIDMEKDPRVPDMVVTTTHMAKGLEWNRVKIAEDFRGPREDPKTGQLIMPDPEEIRIAYVAVTRAMGELDPGSLSWIYDYSDDNGGVVEPTAPEAPDQVAELPSEKVADLPTPSPTRPTGPGSKAIPEAERGFPTPTPTPTPAPDPVTTADVWAAVSGQPFKATGKHLTTDAGLEQIRESDGLDPNAKVNNGSYFGKGVYVSVDDPSGSAFQKENLNENGYNHQLDVEISFERPLVVDEINPGQDAPEELIAQALGMKNALEFNQEAIGKSVGFPTGDQIRKVIQDHGFDAVLFRQRGTDNLEMLSGSQAVAFSPDQVSVSHGLTRPPVPEAAPAVEEAPPIAELPAPAAPTAPSVRGPMRAPTPPATELPDAVARAAQRRAEARGALPAPGDEHNITQHGRQRPIADRPANRVGPDKNGATMVVGARVKMAGWGKRPEQEVIITRFNPRPQNPSKATWTVRILDPNAKNGKGYKEYWPQPSALELIEQDDPAANLLSVGLRISGEDARKLAHDQVAEHLTPIHQRAAGDIKNGDKVEYLDDDGEWRAGVVTWIRSGDVGEVRVRSDDGKGIGGGKKQISIKRVRKIGGQREAEKGLFGRPDDVKAPDNTPFSPPSSPDDFADDLRAAGIEPVGDFRGSLDHGDGIYTINGAQGSLDINVGAPDGTSLGVVQDPDDARNMIEADLQLRRSNWRRQQRPSSDEINAVISEIPQDLPNRDAIEAILEQVSQLPESENWAEELARKRLVAAQGLLGDNPLAQRLDLKARIENPKDSQGNDLPEDFRVVPHPGGPEPIYQNDAGYQVWDTGDGKFALLEPGGEGLAPNLTSWDAIQKRIDQDLQQRAHAVPAGPDTRHQLRDDFPNLDELIQGLPEQNDNQNRMPAHEQDRLRARIALENAARLDPGDEKNAAPLDLMLKDAEGLLRRANPDNPVEADEVKAVHDHLRGEDVAPIERAEEVDVTQRRGAWPRQAERAPGDRVEAIGNRVLPEPGDNRIPEGGLGAADKARRDRMNADALAAEQKMSELIRGTPPMDSGAAEARLQLFARLMAIDAAGQGFRRGDEARALGERNAALQDLNTAIFRANANANTENIRNDLDRAIADLRHPLNADLAQAFRQWGDQAWPKEETGLFPDEGLARPRNLRPAPPQAPAAPAEPAAAEAPGDLAPPPELVQGFNEMRRSIAIARRDAPQGQGAQKLATVAQALERAAAAGGPGSPDWNPALGDAINGMRAAGRNKQAEGLLRLAGAFKSWHDKQGAPRAEAPAAPAAPEAPNAPQAPINVPVPQPGTVDSAERDQVDANFKALVERLDPADKARGRELLKERLRADPADQPAIIDQIIDLAPEMVLRPDLKANRDVQVPNPLREELEQNKERAAALVQQQVGQGAMFSPARDPQVDFRVNGDADLQVMSREFDMMNNPTAHKHVVRIERALAAVGDDERAQALASLEEGLITDQRVDAARRVRAVADIGYVLPDLNDPKIAALENELSAIFHDIDMTPGGAKRYVGKALGRALVNLDPESVDFRRDAMSAMDLASGLKDEKLHRDIDNAIRRFHGQELRRGPNQRNIGRMIEPIANMSPDEVHQGIADLAAQLPEPMRGRLQKAIIPGRDVDVRNVFLENVEHMLMARGDIENARAVRALRHDVDVFPGGENNSTDQNAALDELGVVVDQLKAEWDGIDRNDPDQYERWAEVGNQIGAARNLQILRDQRHKGFQDSFDQIKGADAFSSVIERIPQPFPLAPSSAGKGEGNFARIHASLQGVELTKTTTVAKLDAMLKARDPNLSADKLGGSHNYNTSFKITDASTGKMYALKHDKDTMGADAEVDISMLYRAVGFEQPKAYHTAPKTVLMEWAGEDIGISNPQQFGRALGSRVPLRQMKLADASEVFRLQISNDIIGNVDRNGGNAMYGVDADGVGHIFPIDNGLSMNNSFGKDKRNDPPLSRIRETFITGAQDYIKRDRVQARVELIQWAEHMRDTAAEHEAEFHFRDALGYITTRANMILNDPDKWLRLLLSM
jgi:hypothetical protein